MGAEQSGQTQSKRVGQLTRAHTIAANPRSDVVSNELDESSEAGELDTTNMADSIFEAGTSAQDQDEMDSLQKLFKPIGESPKKQSRGAKLTKHLSESLDTKLNSREKLRNNKKWRKNSGTNIKNKIVVVKKGKEDSTEDIDDDLSAIQNVPIFQPIIRDTIGITSSIDKGSLAGLNYANVYRLALRLQDFIKVKTESVTTEQNKLTRLVKETDQEISRLLSLMVERQRANAKMAERLSKVHEMSAQLSRCHSSLNQSLELVDILNEKLSIEDRMEPFIWTTR